MGSSVFIAACRIFCCGMWDLLPWPGIRPRSPAFGRDLGIRPGEGNGTPLQYSCLENPMDGGAWWAAVHGVAKSQTWLSDFTFTFHFSALEKEMATHSSVLAWRIPGMGSHRVGHDWSDLAAAVAVGIRPPGKSAIKYFLIKVYLHFF